jgi:small neutral amino acid transporter SnatA (MarC family)
MQEGGSSITGPAAVLVYAVVLPILYLSPLIRGGGGVGILAVSGILCIFIAAKAATSVITGIRSCMEIA